MQLLDKLHVELYALFAILHYNNLCSSFTRRKVDGANSFINIKGTFLFCCVAVYMGCESHNRHRNAAVLLQELYFRR